MYYSGISPRVQTIRGVTADYTAMHCSLATIRSIEEPSTAMNTWTIVIKSISTEEKCFMGNHIANMRKEIVGKGPSDDRLARGVLGVVS